MGLCDIFRIVFFVTPLEELINDLFTFCKEFVHNC